MKKKIEKLIKHYEECIEHCKDLAEKAENDFAKGLHCGHIDSLTFMVEDLKEIIEEV